MPYDIPRSGLYRIQPFKMQDDEALVASLANQLLKARLAEARAAARGGGGGGRGGSGKEKKGKGAWVMVFDKDTGRYEKKWVEGSTEKERKITMKAEAFNETLDRLGQNPEVSKLLGALRNPGASNLTKREALKKLTDLKRDPAFSDLDSAGVDEAFAKFTGPDAAAVQEEKKKIDSSSTFGTLGTSLQNAWDRLTTTVGTFGASDAEKIAASKASSERQARRREADPWLREQDLREQEEQEMNRGWYAKAGGIGGALTNAADTILSDPGMDTALAATALAATAPVSVPMAAATTGLAVAGGALSGDTIFRERLANDPNLTDAQKAEAYGEGAFREQAIGGALNAMPSILGRVGPMVRASRAARGLEGVAAQTARAESLARVAPRFKYDMPLVAAEGAGVNAGQMALSNQNYGAVTNQDVDLSEGVGEAALMGLAFGLASGAGSGVSAWRGARARRQAAQQFKADQQTPEAMQSAEEAEKGAEEILNAKDKKASESQPAAAKPDEGGQTPPDAGAPASPASPATPPEGPAPAGEAAAQPAQPSAARPAEPQSSAAQAAPQAPDLPTFKKSEASRQQEARGFEEDLGEEFEAKFRASKEYEGYARYDALRRSYENSGALDDADQTSLNANIARADEGRRLWRERFILDNWKEAKAADAAAKAAKRAAAQREAETQVAMESMPAGQRRSDVGRTPPPADWTPIRVSLETMQERVAREQALRNASSPSSFDAAVDEFLSRSTVVPGAPRTSSAGISLAPQAKPKKATPRSASPLQQSSQFTTANPAKFRRRAGGASWNPPTPAPRTYSQPAAPQAPASAAPQVRPTPEAANASLRQTGAVPGRPMSKQETVRKLADARAKKPAKPDLPFSDKDLRTISTYSSKPTDRGKNALIQKNPQFADENALQKLDITRKALQDYGQKTYNRMNVEKLIKSIDELSARVRTLRGENEPGRNAGSEPSAALGYAGRWGEEVSHPENSGNDSQVAANTSADTGTSPRGSAEEVRVRRAKNQGKRDGGGTGKRSAEASDSESGAGNEGNGRQSRGEEPVGKPSAEQPAETGARAGEGERSAESEADAVARSAADRGSIKAAVDGIMADRHGLVALADELNSRSISNATRDMLVRTGLWNREGLNSLWDSLQQNPLLLDLYPSIKSGIDYALRQAKRDADALAAKAVAKAGREASVNDAWRSLAPAKGTKGDILKGIFNANRGAFTKVEKVKTAEGPAMDFSAYGDEAERTQNFGNEARAVSLEIARNGKGAESVVVNRPATVSTVMTPGTPEFNAAMADLLNDALDSARTFYSAGVAKASVKGVKGLDAAVLNTLVDVPSLLHSKKRLDATDVELMLDPDSARVNGDAVLNGDKPLC